MKPSLKTAPTLRIENIERKQKSEESKSKTSEQYESSSSGFGKGSHYSASEQDSNASFNIDDELLADQEPMQDVNSARVDAKEKEEVEAKAKEEENEAVSKIKNMFGNLLKAEEPKTQVKPIKGKI